MSKYGHTIAALLGVVILVLSFVQSLPAAAKYGSIISAVILFCVDRRKALAPTGDALSKVVSVVFMVLLLGHAMFGCATTKAVVADCAPAGAQATADVLAILDNPTLSNAEAVAALEASKVALCAITVLAKAAIQEAMTMQLDTAAPNPRIIHAQAWVQAHP